MVQRVIVTGGFQGRNLRRGVRTSDYRVVIGKDECNVSSLSDSVLTCRPPFIEPELSPDNTCGILFNSILVRNIQFIQYNTIQKLLSVGLR